MREAPAAEKRVMYYDLASENERRLLTQRPPARRLLAQHGLDSSRAFMLRKVEEGLI